MASYKSQLSLSGSGLPAAKLQRKQSSRLPTRAVTPTSSDHHELVKSTRVRLADDHASAYRQRDAGYQHISAKELDKHAPRSEDHAGSVGSPPINQSVYQSTTRLPRFDAAYSSTPPPSSGASSAERPRRVLRKKASSIGKPAPHSVRIPMEQKSQTSESMGEIHRGQDADLVFGIPLPQRRGPSSGREAGSIPTLYEHGTRSTGRPEALPLPISAYAISTSPSTRYSESPGRFSHSSSPTSMSSFSPGTAFSSKSVGPRTRQRSPTRSRPPPVRRATEGDAPLGNSQGLPSVRESSNSSSSASTVVPTETAKESRSVASPSSQSDNRCDTDSRERRNRPRGITIQTRISVGSTHAAPIFPPPELAHLADPQPAQPSFKARPIRPSREGTPDLSGLQQTSPIVHSNLTSLPGRHKRQTSAGSNVLSNGGTSVNSSKTNLGPTKASYDSSPNPSLNSAFSPASYVPTTRGTTPELSDGERGLRSAVSPTNSNPGKSPSSRFGFFSRRNKSEPAASVSTKDRKLLKKGPMAGTGHEGYGKYSGRGRGASTTTTPGSLSRSTSASSHHESSSHLPYSRKGSVTGRSEPEVDEFYRDRLAPKVLRGTRDVAGSVSTNSEAGRSGSSLGSNPGLSSPEDRNDSTAPTPEWNRSAEWSKPTLLPSAMSAGASPTREQDFPQRQPSEDEGANVPSGLHQRHDGRLLSQGMRPDSSYELDTTSPSDHTGNVRHIDPDIPPVPRLEDVSEGKEGNWLKPKKKTLQEKPSRKWNFFQWAQANPSSRAEDDEKSPSAEETSQKEPARYAAHYALQDADGQLDMEELDRIMQEAVRAGETPMSSRPPSLQFAETFKNQHESILLPSPPMIPNRFDSAGPPSPKVLLRHPEWAKAGQSSVAESDEPPARQHTRTPSPTHALSPTSSPPRPSRLARVGRIPAVVSQKDLERRLSNRSFSRPFALARPSPALNPPPLLQDLIDTATNLPRPESPPVDEDPQKEDRKNKADQEPPLVAQPEEATVGPLEAAPEFFAFPRKYSDLSYSSTSSIPPSTAIVPPPGAPLQEDEVWNEYDDLIEDVLSCPETVSPTAARHQPPSPRKEDGPEISTNKESATPQPPTSSLKQGPDAREVSVHLRRSRLLAAFQALATPSSPGNMSECMTEGGDREHDIAGSDMGRLSLPSIRLSQTTARPVSACSRISESVMEGPPQPSAQSNEKLSPAPVGFQQRDSKLVKIAEGQRESGVSMANLRFGALMTSKWLSFGRVLFSPAHSNIRSGRGNGVLVLDGLGNDWSYYCALTYPEASIYNLGPAPNTSENTKASPYGTLPNYRHIHHPNPQAPFPFPKGFFAAVVFRFPAIATDTVYRSLISECKRVLRPGGHLELSVLDLDMQNMGNRARRAVRALKVRLQAATPDISLSPASDTIQRMLGRRGFENLNRCIVGLPTTGKVSEVGGEEIMNFGDLLKGRGGEGGNEENITRMVAKVGRWWYSRCFESGALAVPAPASAAEEGGALGGKSIWDDETLLRECEARQTSFRLLICYAQKPEAVIRRTASV